MMQQSLQSSMGNMALHNTGVAQAMMPQPQPQLSMGNIHQAMMSQQLPQSQQFQFQQFLSQQLQQFQQQFHQQLQQQLQQQFGGGPARQESTATSGVSNKNDEGTDDEGDDDRDMDSTSRDDNNDQALHNGGEEDVPKRANTKRANGDRGTDKSSNSQMARSKSPRASLTSAATKSGKTTLSSGDEGDDDGNDRDVASSSGEDDLPPTKTCIHFDDALNRNSQSSCDRIEFIKNSTYVHENALSKEWTPKSGEIKKGNVLKLPGGRNVTIQGKLGSGAFGAVYLVKLDDQSESYALKVQRSVSGMTDSLSFECETQWDLDYKLHNLLGYDPVPRPIELHRFSNGSLFFMTAVNGKTLHDIVNAHKMKRKTTPEDVVVLIAFEMLKLFGFLHRKGNIMVRRMSSRTN